MAATDSGDRDPSRTGRRVVVVQVGIDDETGDRIDVGKESAQQIIGIVKLHQGVLGNVVLSLRHAVQHADHPAIVVRVDVAQFPADCPTPLAAVSQPVLTLLSVKPERDEGDGSVGLPISAAIGLANDQYSRS